MMVVHDKHTANTGTGPQAELNFVERVYIPEILRGMVITLRHFFANVFFQKYITTVKYPEEKARYPEGFRGMHRLTAHADGRPKCVACYMCARVCPAQCIFIEAGEYPDRTVDEKYPVSFTIDELRCVVCGLCVEACPKDAIRMDSGLHPTPAYTREHFLYERDELLAIEPGKPESMARNLALAVHKLQR